MPTIKECVELVHKIEQEAMTMRIAFDALGVSMNLAGATQFMAAYEAHREHKRALLKRLADLCPPGPVRISAYRIPQPIIFREIQKLCCRLGIWVDVEDVNYDEPVQACADDDD